MGIEFLEKNPNDGRIIEASELPPSDEEVVPDDNLSDLLEEKNRLAKMLGEAHAVEDPDKSLELKKRVYNLLNENDEKIAKIKVESPVDLEVDAEEGTQAFDEDKVGDEGVTVETDDIVIEEARAKDEEFSEERMIAARAVIEAGEKGGLESASDKEVENINSEINDGGPADSFDAEESSGMNRREFLKKAGDVAKVAAAEAIIPGGLVKNAEAVSQVLEKGMENPLEKLGKGWEKYKEVVAGSNVRENIKFLEEKYGPNANGMTYLVKHHLELFDQLLSAEEEGSSVSQLNQGGLLSSSVKEFHTYWDQEQLDLRNKKHEQENGLNAEIDGFDKIPGWTNEKLQAKLEDDHDKRWLYGNISSFEYIDESKEAKTFSVGGEAHAENLAGIFYKSGNEKVKIYKPENHDEEALLETISHEIGHHQDWANNNRMPLQERLQFLKEVTEHFQSPERFHSVYVEVDTPNEFEDLPEEEMKYRQIGEYWAVLVERYDRHGEMLKEHQPNDFDLVDRWKKRISEAP